MKSIPLIQQRWVFPSRHRSITILRFLTFEMIEYLRLLFWQAQEQASTMVLIALPLLLLRFIKSEEPIQLTLRSCLASSSRINLVTYAIDLVIISAPLSLLLSWWRNFIERGSSAIFAVAWFEALPTWTVIALVVFVGDGIGYFRHRLEHSAWLWPSHSLHHSDEAMNVLTTLRFHPINRFSTIVIDMGLLLAIGFPASAVFAASAVRHVYGVFLHANVPWTLGPLGWILASPAMHRWHHVREGCGIGTNFASVFSVFDRVFGTYYCPGPCDQPTGVHGIEPNRFLPQWVGPFIQPYKAICRRLGGQATAQR